MYSGNDTLNVLRGAERYNQFLIDEVVRHAGDAKHVVDFGAGIGTFASALAKRGLSVTCVEPDAVQAAELGKQSLTCVAELGQLQPGAHDYAYSLNVLEHIEDDAAAVRTLAAALGAGGRLYTYVPAFPVLYSSLDKKVGHHRRYRRRQLVELLESNGFRVLRVRYADSLGFFAALINRFVGSRDGSIDEGQLQIYDRLVFPFSRALDRVTGRLFGKNLAVFAVRSR